MSTTKYELHKSMETDRDSQKDVVLKKHILISDHELDLDYVSIPSISDHDVDNDSGFHDIVGCLDLQVTSAVRKFSNLKNRCKNYDLVKRDFSGTCNQIKCLTIVRLRSVRGKDLFPEVVDDEGPPKSIKREKFQKFVRKAKSLSNLDADNGQDMETLIDKKSPPGAKGSWRHHVYYSDRYYFSTTQLTVILFCFSLQRDHR